VLRPSDDSPTGFITETAGFGLDDVVKYGVMAMAAVAAYHLVSKGA
jgi:hypothetical protein